VALKDLQLVVRAEMTDGKHRGSNWLFCTFVKNFLALQCLRGENTLSSFHPMPIYSDPYLDPSLTMIPAAAADLLLDFPIGTSAPSTNTMIFTPEPQLQNLWSQICLNEGQRGTLVLSQVETMSLLRQPWR
jgi:hypothetical protein